MVHTYFLDGKGDIPLHGEFNRWLNMRTLHGRCAKPWNPQRGWDVEIAHPLVQIADSVVARDLCAKGLLVDDAETLRGKAVLPCRN